MTPPTTGMSPLWSLPGALTDNFEFSRDTPDTQASKDEVLSDSIIHHDEAIQRLESTSEVNWLVVGGMLLVAVVLFTLAVRYVLLRLTR